MVRVFHLPLGDHVHEFNAAQQDAGTAKILEIGTTLVDGYGFGRAILIDGPLEVPSGRFLVPLGSQQEVNRVAGLVDGAVEILPCASDLHIGLVDTPALADRALAPAERLFKHRQKLDGPSVHGRMIDRDPAFGHHLL